jgi:hypothetical protein
MNATVRTLVTTEELIAELNKRVHAHEDLGEDFKVRSVTPLRGTDQSGCNWSDPILRASGREHDNFSKRAWVKIVEATQREFNLAVAP